MSDVPADVKVGHVLLALARGISDKAIRWAAILLSCGIGIGAMVRPDPVRAGLATLLICLLSPLWLRRERDGG